MTNGGQHPEAAWHPTAPERYTTTTWQEFIRTHLDVLVATDFFTAEVWTLGGLVTYYVLFFIRLGTREVHVAEVTPYPNHAWMMQIARNITMEPWGFLASGQYLIHDRDGKYGPAFRQIIDAAGSHGCHCRRGRHISTPTRNAGCAPSKRRVSHG